MLNTEVMPFERGSESKIYSSLTLIESQLGGISSTFDKYLTHVTPTVVDKIFISSLCIEHVLCVLYTGINACHALDLSTLGLSTALCATVVTAVMLYPLYELWAYDTKQANIKSEISNALARLLSPSSELIDTLQHTISKLVNLDRVETQLMEEIKAHFELLKTQLTDLGEQLNDNIRNVSFDLSFFSIHNWPLSPSLVFLDKLFVDKLSLDKYALPPFRMIAPLPLYNLTTALNHLRLEGGRIIMPLLCLSACVQILGYVAIHYATISGNEKFLGFCAFLAIFCWYKGMGWVYDGAEQRLFSPLPLQAVEEAMTAYITERGKGLLVEVERAQSSFYRMIAKLEKSQSRYYD